MGDTRRQEYSEEYMKASKWGSWTVTSYSHVGTGGNKYFSCICDCGEIGVVKGTNLRRGLSTKCKLCNAKANGRKGLYAKSCGDLYVFRLNEYIKIGFSEDVPRRLRELSSATPYVPILVYHGIGKGNQEELWHDIFKPWHHKGEWFIIDDYEFKKQLSDIGCDI